LRGESESILISQILEIELKVRRNPVQTNFHWSWWTSY